MTDSEVRESLRKMSDLMNEVRILFSGALADLPLRPGETLYSALHNVDSAISGCLGAVLKATEWDTVNEPEAS